VTTGLVQSVHIIIDKIQAMVPACGWHRAGVVCHRGVNALLVKLQKLNGVEERWWKQSLPLFC
jgi:hypothetical protein